MSHSLFVKRAVIIEPNAGLRNDMKRELVQLGISIVGSSGNANAGVAKVIESPPELLITAMDLPDATGIDIIQKLHAENSYHKNMHIIVLLDPEHFPNIERMLEFGLSGFIQKPLRSSHITNYIERLNALFKSLNQRHELLFAYTAAKYYEANKQYDKAKDVLEQANKVEESGLIHFEIGAVFALLGDKVKSKMHMVRAKELDTRLLKPVNSFIKKHLPIEAGQGSEKSEIIRQGIFSLYQMPIEKFKGDFFGEDIINSTLIVGNTPPEAMRVKGLLNFSKIRKFNVASRGAQAFELMEIQKSDLVIIPLSMTDMNALQFIEYVRNQMQSKVRIMIYLEKVQTSNLPRAFELGADGFITYPMSRDTLMQSLHSMMIMKALQSIQNFSYRTLVAQAFYDIERHKDAQKYAKDALDLNHEDPVARLIYAMSCHCVGNTKDAIYHYLSFHEANPDLTNVVKRIKNQTDIIGGKIVLDFASQMDADEQSEMAEILENIQYIEAHDQFDNTPDEILSMIDSEMVNIGELVEEVAVDPQDAEIYEFLKSRAEKGPLTQPIGSRQSEADSESSTLKPVEEDPLAVKDVSRGLKETKEMSLVSNDGSNEVEAEDFCPFGKEKDKYTKKTYVETAERVLQITNRGRLPLRRIEKAEVLQELRSEHLELVDGIGQVFSEGSLYKILQTDAKIIEKCHELQTQLGTPAAFKAIGKHLIDEGVVDRFYDVLENEATTTLGKSARSSLTKELSNSQLMAVTHAGITLRQKIDSAYKVTVPDQADLDELLIAEKNAKTPLDVRRIENLFDAGNWTQESFAKIYEVFRDERPADARLAFKVFNRSIDKSSERQRALGRYMLQTAQYVQAYKVFDGMYKSDSRDRMSLMEKAIAALEGGMYGECSAILKKLINLRFDMANTYNIQGILYKRMNRPMRSVKCYQRGLTYNSKLSKLWYNLAIVYAELNMIAECIDAQKQFENITGEVMDEETLDIAS